MADDALSKDTAVEHPDVVTPEPELGASNPGSEKAVSLADLENNEQEESSFQVQLNAALTGLSRVFQKQQWLPFVVVGMLLLLFLLLPPISLISRIAGSRGYTALTADEPSLSHEDGLTVTVSDAQTGKLRLKLNSLPRADFVNGDVDAEVKAAREAIPAHLTPKSPFYNINVRGELEEEADLTVVIPNEAEPWETLDLYAWDGEAWQWLPNHLDRADEVLSAELSALPETLMVMQTERTASGLIAPSQDLPPADYSDLLNGVDLFGMKIGTQGGMTGDAALFPPGSVSSTPILAPVVRNWVFGRVPNRLLVADMLGDEEARATHIQNLVDLASDAD
jgi:hypothetical protein